MTLRRIPTDPKVKVTFGWCVQRPKFPPRSCTWCGAEFEKQNGGLRCPECDYPPPFPEPFPEPTTGVSDA